MIHPGIKNYFRVCWVIWKLLIIPDWVRDEVYTKRAWRRLKLNIVNCTYLASYKQRNTISVSSGMRGIKAAYSSSINGRLAFVIEEAFRVNPRRIPCRSINHPYVSIEIFAIIDWICR